MVLVSFHLPILCAEGLEVIGSPGHSKHSYIVFYSDEIGVDCYLFSFLPLF